MRSAAEADVSESGSAVSVMGHLSCAKQVSDRFVSIRATSQPGLDIVASLAQRQRLLHYPRRRVNRQTSGTRVIPSYLRGPKIRGYRRTPDGGGVMQRFPTIPLEQPLDESDEESGPSSDSDRLHERVKLGAAWLCATLTGL